jgi:hypothetical protein
VADELMEELAEVGGAGEAKLRRDLGGRRVAVCQETFGFQAAPPSAVTPRRRRDRRAAESDTGHAAGLAAGTVICVNSPGGASLAQITGVPCSALLVPMVVIGGIVTHAERRLAPGRGR